MGEWRLLTLREAGIELIDCDHRTPATAPAGFPYVGIPQLRDGRIVLDGVRRISQEDFVSWTRKARPKEHDVVLSRRCNPGETAGVPSGLEFALGQNLVLLRSNGPHVFPGFLRWLTRGPQWWNEVRRYLNVGAVFDSLKCADIPEFRVWLPPPEEQKTISATLSALDDKIDLNRRMSATLEEMARALFRSWFVDFDPVRAKAEGRDPGLPADIAALFPDRFEESEQGEIPVGWEVRRLEDLCRSIFSGGTPSTQRADFWDGGIPWLSSGETRTRIIVETERTISTVGVEYSSTRLARRGTTVIASAGQGTTRGQTSWLALESYVNQSVVVVEADRDQIPDSFVFFDLERRYDEFRRLSDGHSSRGSLTTKLLAALPVVVPPAPLLIKFASVAASCLDRSCSLQLESRTLAALRDSLLPKLISGELRVPEELLERASEAPAG